MIEALTLDDPRVLTECRHWSTGRRGDPVGMDALASADLSAFVIQAMSIGADAITAAAGVQQRYGIEQLVAEVEQRSTQAAADAATRTAKAVDQASGALEKASEQARRAVVDAGATARQAFAESVAGARQELSAQIVSLVGGDEPELLRRLQPVLGTFSRSLQDRATAQTEVLIHKVAQQFNPADPTSPMAQQMRSLVETQERYAKAAAEQQQALGDKIDELSRGLSATKATELALSHTAAKGETYEEQVHELMAAIAAGLGDEYVETGTVAGLRIRSKKGDGVLTVVGSDTRVVLEMTDSARTGWNAYLQQAEENRAAQASLGLVRSPSQLTGSSLQTLGPRRVVMVFDPEVDDPQLLRCVVQLLRLAAVAAAARVDSGEIATADELITAALVTVERIAKIERSARQIRVSATSIDNEAGELQTELTRQLSQARTALAGAAAEVRDDVA